jgi:ATP/maltotriose-dependent transcriptional regulator MalT/DNA-binding SARP family transcriptional activator
VAASTLPRYHVLRPRLISRLQDARVAVVEAGGGYGKTTLAAELAHAVDAVAVRAQLGADDGAPDRLVARVLRAIRRSGLSALAALLGTTDSPSDWVDDLLDSLTGFSDPVLLLVDDAHVLSTAAATLCARIATDLPDPHRLAFLGRAVPSELKRAPGAVVLQNADLAFTAEETALLCASLGVDVGEHDSKALQQATGGWAAALVLAGEQLTRAADPGAEVQAIAAQPRLLSYLVREELARLPPEARAALPQLAHLPLIDERVADAATGVPGLVQQAIAAGLPFQPEPDGRLDLPGPMRELLADSAPLDPDVAARAAAAYVEDREIAAAAQVLLAAGEDEAVAELLAELPLDRLERLDFGELRTIVDALSPAAVERHPRVLLHLARACEAAAQARVRSEALERAAGLLAGNRDLRLRRELDAEVARDLVRDAQFAAAAEIAERLLDEAGPDELETRVRALHVLGRTHTWHPDPASLARADALLEEAASLYLRLGNESASAHALLGLAYDVYLVNGRFDEALERLERVLARLSGRTRLRAVVLTFRAEALVELGRYPEAEASLAEAHALGTLVDDGRTLAYVAWVRARAASQRGDPVGTAEQLAETGRHQGDWFDHHTGVEFLADAAVILDRVGERVSSREYLERALARAGESEAIVRFAEAAVLARSGDPDSAETALRRVEAMPYLQGRERWRVALLRACAAHRRADEPSAREHAARAFAEAAALGHPELPLVKERELAERLRPLVPGAVHPAALPVSIQALGAFEALRGGAPLELPAGRPAQLVKLLAASGGRIGAEQAIEALWPDVESESGRGRLRVVLTRLRKAAGDLVVRDGEALALAKGAEVDATVFETEARRALAGRGDEAVATARSALARYAGPLLPDDRYEPWASEPRERLSRLQLSLLDLLARDAAERGETDEAIRLLEEAIEADRYDERRYLAVARLLLRQGRRGRALEVLRASAAALHELDLEPSAEHRDLVREARA